MPHSGVSPKNVGLASHCSVDRLTRSDRLLVKGVWRNEFMERFIGRRISLLTQISKTIHTSSTKQYMQQAGRHVYVIM